MSDALKLLAMISAVGASAINSNVLKRPVHSKPTRPARGKRANKKRRKQKLAKKARKYNRRSK